MADTPADTVKVKAFATLRKFVPAENDIPADTPIPIAELIAVLEIPPRKVTVIFLNGRHADPGDIASPGDTVSLFPPVGGG